MKCGRHLYFGGEWALLFVLLPAVVLLASIPAMAAVNARQGDLTLFWLALASVLVGIVLLFMAKLPLFRQGRYFTFGSKALPKGHRRIYRIAYIFIITGVLTMLLLLAVLR